MICSADQSVFEQASLQSLCKRAAASAIRPEPVPPEYSCRLKQDKQEAATDGETLTICHRSK